MSVHTSIQDLARTGWEQVGTKNDPAPRPEDRIPLLTIDDLIENYSEPVSPVIEGLLRRGEVMNIVGPPKSRKTWLSHDLGLSVATGASFLERFPTHRGRVLLIDNELHKPTLSNRLWTLISARGSTAAKLSGEFMVMSLRGKLIDLNSLRQQLDGLEGDEFSLVILDAMYRFLPEGVNESDNAHITRVYNTLDRYAAKLNAAFVCVHHTSKGNQASKGVTDVGSGAGAQSRAADTHLVIREHEDEGAASVHAVVRSWKPVEPFVIRWNFPRWTIDEQADPAALKKEGRTGKSDPTPEEFIENCVPKGSTLTREEIEELASHARISKRCVSRMIKACVPELLKEYRYASNVAVKYGRVT